MSFYQSTMLPVDGITSGNTQCAAMKLNELFFLWMTLPDTKDFIDTVVADALRDAHVQDHRQRPHSDSPQHHDHSQQSASPPMSPCRIRHHSPQPTGNHLNADEMDMAHRAGAISPRAQSPSSPTSQPHPMNPFRPQAQTAPPAHVPHHVPSPPVSIEMSIPITQPVYVSPAHSAHKETKPRIPVRRTATEQDIPQFYFSMGKESTRAKDKAVAPPVVDIGTTLQNIFSSRAMPSPSASVQKKKSLFTKVGKGSVKDVKGGVGDGKTLKSTQFQEVAGAFQLPKWMGAIIFNKIISWEQSRDPAAVVPSPSLTYETARQYYDMELHGKNPVWRLFHTIRQDPARPYLIPSDMYPLVKELLRVHPGLEFLKQTPEFMDKYAETVVIRMFYYVDNTANGKITYSQFERSNLPSVMLRLDDEDDINVVRDYFSYEHFYVLYCKFWELDTDRDYLIGKADLARYGGGCVSAKALDRVVNGHARRLSSGKPGKLNFEDFVWFCISEEDKSTPQSLLYWFRVVDLDNDGILAGFEIDVFLQEQKARMHQMSIEAIALEDIVCQMIDMVKPKDPKCITMRDFRACPTAGVFFNVLMNLNKFLIFEQRDPFAAHAEKQLAEKTDWDRFARSEYDRMALEAEGGDDDLDGHASWK